MHKLINKDYLQILDIYSSEKPDFLLPFLESRVMQRLAFISQNCGTDYPKLFDYKIRMSRLDHSLGVALIIWHFTRDIKQTLAGLFHDVSHSVFSHVGDFILGDQINQESSEQHTNKLLSEDDIIINELDKLGIKLSEVEDYTIYSIADNPGPQLSADRLEYTLSNPIALGTRSLDEIKSIYDNIFIGKNEKSEDEMIFKDFEYGEKLGYLSIENDSGCFSSYESVVSMSFLSEIIKYMLLNKLVNNMDLYILNDIELIDIIKKSNDKKLISMWDYFLNISSYKIDRYIPKTNKYFVSSITKRRFIDPLIKTNDGINRLSSLSEEFKIIRDYHKGRREEWIRLDYEF